MGGRINGWVDGLTLSNKSEPISQVYNNPQEALAEVLDCIQTPELSDISEGSNRKGPKPGSIRLRSEPPLEASLAVSPSRPLGLCMPPGLQQGAGEWERRL